MKHPMPRNRRKLKLRAARWRAHKEDSLDGFAARVVTGKSLNNLIKGAGSAQPRGVLHA